MAAAASPGLSLLPGSGDGHALGRAACPGGWSSEEHPWSSHGAGSPQNPLPARSRHRQTRALTPHVCEQAWEQD